MDANTPTSKISADSLSGLVNFGDTDLLVSKYCQGTAFGVLGRSSDNPEGQKVLEYCLDVGVNFFDSSNGYGWGGSEITLGKAVKNRRAEAIICTKIAPYEMPDTEDGDPIPAKYTAEFLTSQLDGALTRLDTDYIDLYMLHHPIKDVPYEDVAQTLDSMVKSGKIRYWGVSNKDSKQLLKLMDVCRDGGYYTPVGLENCYNIANTPQGDELFPALLRTGLGFLTCRPHLGGNLFPKDEDVSPETPAGKLISTIEEVSEEIAKPVTQVCIAWSLSNPSITCILTCSESEAHVDDNQAGTTLELPQEALDRLSLASKTYTDHKLTTHDHLNGRWVKKDAE